MLKEIFLIFVNAPIFLVCYLLAYFVGRAAYWLVTGFKDAFKDAF